MSRPVLVRVVAPILALVLIGVGVLGWHPWRDAGDDLQWSDAPTELADQVARDFFTLDYRHLDQDLARVRANASGDFAQQYEQQSADLRKAVTTNKLTLEASIPKEGTAVESFDGETADVLVSVDVRTAAGGVSTQDGRYRTRLELTRDGDRWSVSRFEQVGASESTSAYVVGRLPGSLTAAVAAAARAVPLALGYDYRRLSAGLQAATAVMTDDFAADFRRTFRASAQRLATEQQAVTQATVRAAGLVSSPQADEATVLVYVDQLLVSNTTMKDSAQPIRVSQNRVLVTLERQDGTWLMSGLTPF